MKLTHASVFSGIGGPEVAATMLGWDNLFHCEINPFGRAVLDYWFPNSKSYEDITTTDFSEWRGRVHVLTGGFPCQPFSYAGQRRGATDDRYLWPYMFRCIDQIQPDWVVAENVAGILTMVEQGEVSQVASSADLFDTLNDIRGYRLRETFTLQRICDDLESHGYAVQPVLVPACAVGAPHRRDRVFIIGRRRDGNDADNAQDTMRSGQLVGRDAKLRNKRDKWDISSGNRKRVRSKAPGSAVGGTDTDTDCKMLEWRQHRNTKGHRQSADGSTGHVCASCSERWTWDEEGAWFPTVSPVHRGNDGLPFDVDDLTIPFSKWRTEALKAYGNAIVPQVMYELFRAIELTYNQ